MSKQNVRYYSGYPGPESTRIPLGSTTLYTQH